MNDMNREEESRYVSEQIFETIFNRTLDLGGIQDQRKHAGFVEWQCGTTCVFCMRQALCEILNVNNL